MNRTMLERCDLFAENRAAVNRSFPLESGYIHQICAAIYAVAGKEISDELSSCRKLIKSSTGVFSAFRSAAFTAFAAYISLEEDPKDALDRTMTLYSLLRERYRSSHYLPTAAFAAEKLRGKEPPEEFAARTDEIFTHIKANHPLLTAGDDLTFAVILAASGKKAADAAAETEECYAVLKKTFVHSGSALALANILASGNSKPEVKCSRTVELYRLLRDAGCRYGTGYELPTLGAVALSSDDSALGRLADNIISANSYLREQRGFGWTLGSQQRLMYCSVLACCENTTNTKNENAQCVDFVALIAAQQAATAALIAASSAASS